MVVNLNMSWKKLSQQYFFLVLLVSSQMVNGTPDKSSDLIKKETKSHQTHHNLIGLSLLDRLIQATENRDRLGDYDNDYFAVNSQEVSKYDENTPITEETNRKLDLIEQELLKAELISRLKQSPRSLKLFDWKKKSLLNENDNKEKKEVVVLKRGKSYVRYLNGNSGNGANNGNSRKGYYTRPCLVNALSCYFFAR